MATRKKIERRVPAKHTIVGERLYEAREKKGWRQLDLVVHADVAPALVSLMETNKAGEVKTGTLVRLCTALGVSSDWLLGLSENPKIR